MPLTTLDPKCALLVIDLQKGISSYPTVHPFVEVVHASSALAEAFRRHGQTVVLVNVDGVAPGRTERGRPPENRPADWTELFPELHQDPGDLLVTKRTWGAFLNTGLDEMLRQRGVTQVVIAGVATSSGVESTAREAFGLGYHVTVAVDAMTDMNLEAHDNSIARIFPKLGETGASWEIIALLGKGVAAREGVTS